MPEAIDFQSVMDELTVFQNAIGKIHANLNNAKNQEILGNVLADIQKARAEVEVEYPKTMKLIHDTARSVLTEAKEMQGELVQKRAEAEQRLASVQAAREEAAMPPLKPEVKVDPALGQMLRTELLDRFGPQGNGDGADLERIREAWQDWD